MLKLYLYILYKIQCLACFESPCLHLGVGTAFADPRTSINGLVANVNR
jgi:hypothetical protein